MNENDTSKTKKFLGWGFFVLYLAILAYLTLFSPRFGRTGRVFDPEVEPSYNLVPFYEIQRFWTYRHQLGLSAVINLLGNVAAFLPAGFLLPMTGEHYQSLLDVLEASVFLSLVVELAQFNMQVGSFDVDDIFLNTIGGFLGFMIWKFCRFLRKRREL